MKTESIDTIVRGSLKEASNSLKDSKFAILLAGIWLTGITIALTYDRPKNELKKTFTEQIKSELSNQYRQHPSAGFLNLVMYAPGLPGECIGYFARRIFKHG